MESVGPLSEIFKVSHAIERGLESLLPTFDEGEDYSYLLERIKALQCLLSAFWEAQDESLLPVLRSKVMAYVRGKCGSQSSQVEIKLGDHTEQLKVTTGLFNDLCEVADVGVGGGTVRQEVKRQIRQLKAVAIRYLRDEEETLETIFQKCLGKADQGRLLVDTLRLNLIFWTLSALNSEEKAKFLKTWFEFADEDGRFTFLRKLGALWARRKPLTYNMEERKGASHQDRSIGETTDMYRSYREKSTAEVQLS